MVSSQKRRQKQLRKARKHRKNKHQNSIGRSVPSGIRMSDVIRHLAEPIVEELGDTVEDIEWIIRWTIAAWNLTLFSPNMRERQLLKLARKLVAKNDESVAMFRWICDLVAERKSQYYPHLCNAIIDVHFTRESADTVYYEVVYTLAPNTQPR